MKNINKKKSNIQYQHIFVLLSEVTFLGEVRVLNKLEFSISFFLLFEFMISIIKINTNMEAVVAQGPNRATVNAMVVGSIPIRGMIYLIFSFSYYGRRRRGSLLDRQCL